MRKNFGKKTWLYPMPVLIVTTYNEDGTPNAMNAAWGGVYDTEQIMLCLSLDHRTTGNIRARGAFTVSIADAAHAEACDYVGMVSGRKVPDKLARAGLHTERAETVDAPVIRELPLALECRLVRFNEDGICIGDIVNVSVDESVLGADGVPDTDRLDAIVFDGIRNLYRHVGKAAAPAFEVGKKLI